MIRSLTTAFFSSPKAWGIFVVAAAVLITGTRTEAAKESREYAIGRKVVNFVLPDVNGDLVALSDFNDKTTVVLFSMGTGCPISNLYLNELSGMQEEFGDQGFQILGINSNAGVTIEDLKKHAEEFDVQFPVLLDADQSVANMLGIKRTSEALLLDNFRIVQYHGRVDDRFGYNHKNAKATRRDLFEAIGEQLAGKEISVATTLPAGCLITPTRAVGPQAEITYANQVSRIIQSRCQECHRPGSIGPFALMDYDDARNWTEMIREVVLQRRMPPWHADPRYGEFTTDRSLSKEQLATVSRLDRRGSAPRRREGSARRKGILRRLADRQTGHHLSLARGANNSGRRSDSVSAIHRADQLYGGRLVLGRRTAAG